MVVKRNHLSLEAGLLTSVWSRAFVLCVQWEATQKAEPWCSRFPPLYAQWITDLSTGSTGKKPTRPTGVCGRIGPLPEQLWEAPHWPQLQRHTPWSPHILLPPVGFVPELHVNSMLFLYTSSYSSVPSSSWVHVSLDWVMALCQFCGTRPPPLMLPQSVTLPLLKRT